MKLLTLRCFLLILLSNTWSMAAQARMLPLNDDSRQFLRNISGGNEAVLMLELVFLLLAFIYFVIKSYEKWIK